MLTVQKTGVAALLLRTAMAAGPLAPARTVAHRAKVRDPIRRRQLRANDSFEDSLHRRAILATTALRT